MLLVVSAKIDLRLQRLQSMLVISAKMDYAYITTTIKPTLNQMITVDAIAFCGVLVEKYRYTATFSMEVYALALQVF